MLIINTIKQITQKLNIRLIDYVKQPNDNSDAIVLKITWLLLNLGGFILLLPYAMIYGFSSGSWVFILNLMFLLCMVAALIVFHFHRKNIENFAFYTQLMLVILTSLKVYAMGGMQQVSTPVFVGLMAPVYALTLPNKIRAIFIFLLFSILIVLATLLNPHQPEDRLFSHYFIGFFIFVFFMFFTLYYFTTQLEKAKWKEKKRVKELDELKTKFYTHIAHEFRTPLSIIMGMVDQMRNDPLKWLEEGHNIVKRNSKNLINLTNQLLDLSKLEAHSMPLNVIQDDIVLYTQYLVESFHSLAEVKKIKLKFSANPKKICMDFDPDKIREIISNLLSNAIKFTPHGGSIKISLGAIEQKRLELIVKDTGIGIPKEQLHKVFDRYFQAKNHLKTLQEGSGLGLALTKEFVKLLNGTINVSSTINKGSTFTIQLPITNKAKEIQLPYSNEIIYSNLNDFQKENDQRDSNNQLKLLIVEDNADVIRYLQSLLANNYQIDIAHNGFEGINKALEIIPDLIISDVMMPVMDGLGLCKQLKENIRTSHIPIVLLTARFDMDSRMEGLKTGADAYLAKPFNRDELFIRIEKLIELRKKLQVRFKSLTDQTMEGNVLENLHLNKEDLFMQKVYKILESHLSDEEFGIDELCQSLAMSRAQLYRKFAALTDTTVYSFIRKLKLNKAKELLLTTDLNVTEVAYDTGFKNLAHFSRIFTKEFGHAPSKTKI